MSQSTWEVVLNLELSLGIDPRSVVYETTALPLSYDSKLVPGIGVEPMSGGYESPILPLKYPGNKLVRKVGLAPTDRMF